MITMVVPTRNRAYTLRKVLPSYLSQPGITELILLDDAGEDETGAVLAALMPQFPAVTCRHVRNDERRGAAFSRQRGAGLASNDFILFCDDDEYLEPGYAAACLELLQRRQAGAVSGRRVYMRDGELPEQALARFGSGSRRRPFFQHVLLQIVNGAHFTGEMEVPFTIANILTRRNLLTQFPFDGHYAKGNGYREESDYQMNLYVNGHSIWVTDATHTIHMPMSEVRTGGQRVSEWRRFLWSVHYDGYFIDKYHAAYRRRSGHRHPRFLVKSLSAAYLFWRSFVRPPLYSLVTRLTDRQPA